MCIHVAKSVLCIRTLQAVEMTFTRTTYMSKSLLQNRRQIMPQEFGERSLWRLLVSNEMGGKKLKKVLVPRTKKKRNFTEKGQGSCEP